jgi:hypothetical protein
MGPTLADILQERVRKPVMPEAYDRRRGELIDPTVIDARPYARAFGAGLIDPMGVPSWLAHQAIGSPKTDWYQRRMQELRDESPVMAGAGSAVLPALLAGPLVGGPLLGAGSATEALTVMPPIMGIGSALGKMRHHIWEPQSQQRPQAAYPTDGAY